MRKEEISAEFQWKKFLRLAGLTEETIPEIQKRELKKAFFAAIGQILIVFREGIGAMENEDEALEVMNNLHDEIQQFWEKEVAEQEDYIKRIAEEKRKKAAN